MASGLVAQMSCLTLTPAQRPASRWKVYSSHSVGCSSFLQGQKVCTGSSRLSRCSSASPLLILAAQNAKKRQRLAEKQRTYNRAHKSAVGTRSRKVIKALADFNLRLPESEADLKPVDKLLAEAYAEIDKAVTKGVLHKNTGARRKSNIAIARQKLLIKAGLYQPAAQP